ncbi:Putative beta-galactosidase A [Verticillium dahliae VDG1]|nr:Putative beta-galactosidase A [Verticillium dahliae VDG1]
MAIIWLAAGLLLLSQALGLVAASMELGTTENLGFFQGLVEDVTQNLASPLLKTRQSNGGAPDPATLYPSYTLSVPIDHFHNESKYEPHTNGSFDLRYWFDDRFYKEGGPVIVLSGGEASGQGRLPFLQKGIVAILAEATNGLGVILEHRYYGASYVTEDLSTENLRFLTTDQALADTAYFAQNIIFPGYEDVNLTSPNTPWIAYGGSYAGAFVAILRKLYPDIFWGTISSSGVTAAVVDFWEYYEAARLFAPEGCAPATQKVTHVVDNILLGGDRDDVLQLKTVFGLGNVTRDVHFASAIRGGIAGLQSVNWDPAVNSPAFALYCGNMTSTEVLYPATNELKDSIKSILVTGGYQDEIDALTLTMQNYIGYVNLTRVSTCRGRPQDSCFGGRTDFSTDDLNQVWRLWQYQVCTEWGYFQTGSGVPESQLPMISRLIDYNFTSTTCREAFNIFDEPKVENINKHGGFRFSFPRVAIIDGEADPWRAATPHKIGLQYPESTVSEPRMIIGGGAVHHWDENGIFKNETTCQLPPQPVKKAQSFIVESVKSWLEEWEIQH